MELTELMQRLEDWNDSERYALELQMKDDASDVVHIEVEWDDGQYDDEGEFFYLIEAFTVWTEDRVYVSDLEMETVYSAPRHPPAEK